MDRSSLQHHYERALDHAAILVALAEHQVLERDPVYDLRPRQMLHLSDHLHLFAFHARKAIELADLIGYAAELPLAKAEDLPPKDIIDSVGGQAHTTKDLWFVLNRIVHSQELAIGESQRRRLSSDARQVLESVSTWTPAVFSVRSDRDGADEQHWVEPKHLVTAFLTMKSGIKEVLDVGLHK